MPYLLDTNVAIHLRDGDDRILDLVEALTDSVMISIVTRVELEGGVYRDAKDVKARRVRLDRLLAAIPSTVFDDDCANAYSRIVANAQYSRRKILDRMIAAQAIARGATLVTMNRDDFQDVAGLDLLVW